MKNHRIIFAATIVGLTVLASRAGAAIIVTDGTLEVHLRSFEVDRTVDVPLVPPITHLALSLSAYLFASETVSFADGLGRISTEVGAVNNLDQGTRASGSLNITEDTPETMWIQIRPIPSLGLAIGRVSLDAVGGGNVVDTGFSLGLHSFDFLAPLSAGQYTLTWSATGQRPGPYNADGFVVTVGVPEPSALLLLAAGSALFTRQRRRRAIRAAEACGPGDMPSAYGFCWRR